MEKYTVDGMRNCLGWCNKQFYSPDKSRIAYCDKCRNEKNNKSKNMSRTEMRAMASSPVAKEFHPTEN